MPLAHAVPILLLAFGEDTTPIRVSYDAPATCPAEAAFYDAIAMRTDHVRRAAGDEPALEVNVRVSRNERGFRGEVRETVNHTESSARSVDGATCKEVVEALSLTIALSVDPNAHAPIAKPPEPVRPLPACPPVPEPPAALPPAAAPATLEVELGLRALTTQVLTSDFNAGAALSFAVLRKTGEHLGASLELSLLFATTGALGTPANHESKLAGLALDACPARFQLGRVELGPCALAVVGVLEASGRGVAQPATIERGWSSGGADFQLSALLGDGFVLEAALGATVPLVKRRFYLSVPGNVIAETPIISPLLRLGLGFRF